MPHPDDDLDELLDELAELTEDDLMVILEAWQAEDEGARRRAWARAKTAIERNGLGSSLERARHEIGRWAAAARSDYHGIGGLLGMPADPARLRMQAAPAALDAVAALLAGDELDQEQRDVLSRPWLALDEELDSEPEEELDGGSPDDPPSQAADERLTDSSQASSL